MSDDLINVGSKEHPVWVHRDARPFSEPHSGGYIDIPGEDSDE